MGYQLLVAGFCTVWLDQAYWQRAIASRPETSVKAYIFGGIAWYGIPFGFATCMGLGCAALTSSASFPTYPDPLSAEQTGAGLSSPATAIALLGKGGAALMLLLLFMAVTSSTSGELIAASSLITFDVYKTYINQTAKSSRLVRVSHLGIIIYGLILAVFCCILNAVNINLTWILTCLGIIVGGAAMPLGLVVLWPRASTKATIAAPYIGLSAGLIAWLVTTKQRSGTLSVATTGDVTNAVAGNVTSVVCGALVSVIGSLIFPGKYHDDDPTHVARNNRINGVAIAPVKTSGTVTPTVAKEKGSPSPTDPTSGLSSEIPQEPEPASAPGPETIAPTGNDIVDFLEAKQIEPLDPALVKKGERLATIFNFIFFAVAVILVPFTLFGTAYIFSKPFFRGWVIVSFIWVWCSMLICVVYPVVESRNALNQISRGALSDIAALFGKRKPKVAASSEVGEGRA